MAEPYEYLTTFLIALLPCAAGLQIVRWLLPGERRLLVVGGLGGGLGIGLVTFGIGALVQIVPLLAAAVLVNSASALLVGWLICQWRRDPLRLDLGRWTWLVGTLLLLVLFIAGVEFVSSIWHANTHENLLIRLGLAAHFLAGNWPPAHPWEPDTIFFYRFGAPLWTAAVALLGGADVFAAGLAVTLVSVLACLWGVAAAVTLLSDKITGLLAGFLVAVAGPQNFLALPNAPFGELTASTAQKLVDIGPARLQEGYVLGESFQQLVPFSYTLVVGLAAAAGVGALAVAVSAGNARLLASLLVGSLAFAGMSVTAEHLLPVMAAALVLAAPVLFLTNRRGQAMALVGLALVGSFLAIIPEGPLAQIVRGPASAGFPQPECQLPLHGTYPRDFPRALALYVHGARAASGRIGSSDMERVRVGTDSYFRVGARGRGARPGRTRRTGNSRPDSAAHSGHSSRRTEPMEHLALHPGRTSARRASAGNPGDRGVALVVDWSPTSACGSGWPGWIGRRHVARKSQPAAWSCENAREHGAGGRTRRREIRGSTRLSAACPTPARPADFHRAQ